jgi:hypothetical protein
VTFSKILLGFTGIAFAGYGLWCAIDPGVVAGTSGLAYPTLLFALALAREQRAGAVERCA